MPAKALLLISSFIITTGVYAIPPPDALISIWQSLLQFLGIASVFIVGAYYSLKQYLGAWQRPILIGLGLVGLIGVGLLVSSYFFNIGNIGWQNTSTSPPVSPAANPNSSTIPPDSSTHLLKGEFLSVEEVIQREPVKYDREWKLKTYFEMIDEANFERQKSKLPNLSLQTITSFTPKALYQHLQNSPEKLFFLDVRGPYERKMFHLPYQASTHYGDLLHDIVSDDLKKQLPKDKRIVILCHSGLRGFLAANILFKQGYTNVSFLQGGLANWNSQKLPIEGDEEYSLNLARYSSFSEFEAKHVENMQKIEIDPGKGFVKDMFALINLPYEVATTEDLNKVIKKSKTRPILIICRSYTGCFHTLNFGYMIEQAGGRVAGVFDRTGEFVIPPNVEFETIEE